MRMIFSVLIWLGGALIGLVADLLNYILAPLFVVWFADEKGWLPWWLWWFQTPTNPLDGGEDYQKNYRFFIGHPKVNEGWRRKINQIWWMYRNPMYGLQHAMGTRIISAATYAVSGPEKVGDKTGAGCVLRTVDTGFLPIFQFYWIRPWKSGKRCIRIHLGWKIWQEPKDGQHCMLVLSLNPWKGFSPVAD